MTGSAYIYQRLTAAWTQVVKLTASDGAVGDQFGFAVALHRHTVAVGANKDDSPYINAGSAYIFAELQFPTALPSHMPSSLPSLYPSDLSAEPTLITPTPSTPSHMTSSAPTISLPALRSPSACPSSSHFSVPPSPLTSRHNTSAPNGNGGSNVPDDALDSVAIVGIVIGCLTLPVAALCVGYYVMRSRSKFPLKSFRQPRVFPVRCRQQEP